MEEKEYSLEQLQRLSTKRAAAEGFLVGTLCHYVVVARLLIQGVDPKLFKEVKDEI